MRTQCGALKVIQVVDGDRGLEVGTHSSNSSTSRKASKSSSNASASNMGLRQRAFSANSPAELPTPVSVQQSRTIDITAPARYAPYPPSEETLSQALHSAVGSGPSSGESPDPKHRRVDIALEALAERDRKMAAEIAQAAREGKKEGQAVEKPEPDREISKAEFEARLADASAATDARVAGVEIKVDRLTAEFANLNSQISSLLAKLHPELGGDAPQEPNAGHSAPSGTPPGPDSPVIHPVYAGCIAPSGSPPPNTVPEHHLSHEATLGDGDLGKHPEAKPATPMAPTVRRLLLGTGVSGSLSAASDGDGGDGRRDPHDGSGYRCSDGRHSATITTPTAADRYKTSLRTDGGRVRIASKEDLGGEFWWPLIITTHIAEEYCQEDEGPATDALCTPDLVAWSGRSHPGELSLEAAVFALPKGTSEAIDNILHAMSSSFDGVHTTRSDHKFRIPLTYNGRTFAGIARITVAAQVPATLEDLVTGILQYSTARTPLEFGTVTLPQHVVFESATRDVSMGGTTSMVARALISLALHPPSEFHTTSSGHPPDEPSWRGRHPPPEYDSRSDRRARWKDGAIADIVSNLNVSWAANDGLLDIQLKIAQSIFDTPGNYRMIIEETRMVKVMTNVSLAIHLADFGTATHLKNHRKRLDNLIDKLNEDYGPAALSAKSSAGDEVLERQVAGVLGVFHTDIRGAFLGTNRAKLLSNECTSLSDRCKQLATPYTGVTFLREVDARFTAYSQVAGPIIIRQINAANYLANFLPDIVALLPDDMQFRATEYWSDIYLRYTDTAGGAPHDLRDQLKAAFGARVSYKAPIHFDVLNLGHVPQTTLERMRRQRMQGAPEARRLARPDDLNVLGGSGLLFAHWEEFIETMTSFSLSGAGVLTAPQYLFSMLPADGTPDDCEADGTPDEWEADIVDAIEILADKMLKSDEALEAKTDAWMRAEVDAARRQYKDINDLTEAARTLSDAHDSAMRCSKVAHGH